MTGRGKDNSGAAQNISLKKTSEVVNVRAFLTIYNEVDLLYIQ
jgi:hypothetical protein